MHNSIILHSADPIFDDALGQPSNAYLHCSVGPGVKSWQDDGQENGMEREGEEGQEGEGEKGVGGACEGSRSRQLTPG